MLVALLLSVSVASSYAASNPLVCPHALKDNSDHSLRSTDILAGFEFIMTSVGFSILSVEEAAQIVSSKSSGRLFEVPEKGGVQFGQFKEALNHLEQVILNLPPSTQKAVVKKMNEIILSLLAQKEAAVISHTQAVKKYSDPTLRPEFVLAGKTQRTPHRISFSKSGITLLTHTSLKFWRFPTTIHPSVSAENHKQAAIFHFNDQRTFLMIDTFERKAHLFRNSKLESFKEKTLPLPSLFFWSESADREKILLLAPKKAYIIDRTVELKRNTFPQPSITEIDLPGEGAEHLALLPDGKIILSAKRKPMINREMGMKSFHPLPPLQIKLWDPKTKKLITLRSFRKEIKKIEVSEDGKRVLIVTRNLPNGKNAHTRILVYDFDGKKLTTKLKTFSALSEEFVSLSPNGQWLSVPNRYGFWENEHGIDIIDIEKKIKRQFPKSMRIDQWSVFSFSPDSQSIAITTEDEPISIWNIEDLPEENLPL